MQALNPAAEFDYSPRVRALFADLRHAGVMTGAALQGEAGAREQGAQVRLQLWLDQGFVHTVRYRAYGCPHFLAACEALARWLEGRRLSDAGGWSRADLERDLALPAAKRARLLILEAVLAELLAHAVAASGT